MHVNIGEVSIGYISAETRITRLHQPHQPQCGPAQALAIIYWVNLGGRCLGFREIHNIAPVGVRNPCMNDGRPRFWVLRVRVYGFGFPQDTNLGAEYLSPKKVTLLNYDRFT